jgi:hypothetical protein
MTVARTTQEVALTLSAVTPVARVSQAATLVLSSNSLHAITSQVCVLMLSENVPDDVVGSNANKYRQIQIAC